MEREKFWERLTKFFKNSESKIDVDKYFEICEQLGQEVDWNKIPVSLNELPDIARTAIEIFNMMGDRIAVDIGYLGKDYTNLALLIDIYAIEDKELFLEIITWLDSRAITKSTEYMKRERDKLKRK